MTPPKTLASLRLAVRSASEIRATWRLARREFAAQQRDANGEERGENTARPLRAILGSVH